MTVAKRRVHIDDEGNIRLYNLSWKQWLGWIMVVILMAVAYWLGDSVVRGKLP